MTRFTRGASRVVYGSIVKPTLFKFKPDAVHNRTATLGMKLQRLSVARAALRMAYAHRDSRLEQTIHGVHFANPIGLSAGFDKNVQLVPLMESIGFGFMTGGSVTGNVCAGNPRPWYHRIPEQKALVVHAGLGNVGSDEVRDRLASDSLTAGRTMPLMLSVARTNSEKSSTDEEGVKDYVRSIENLRDFPNMFEINISCPNTHGGMPFTTPERLEKLLAEIDRLNLRQPVFIKMPGNLEWEPYEKLLQVIIRHTVHGVTVSNLRKDRDGVNVSDDIKGSISGLPTQARSDELIRKTYEAYGDKLSIIGVGGVFTAEDAYRKIKNGASLVALITGMIYEGPQIVGDINAGLVELLIADGYTNINQAVGAAVRQK